MGVKLGVLVIALIKAGVDGAMLHDVHVERVHITLLELLVTQSLNGLPILWTQGFLNRSKLV